MGQNGAEVWRFRTFVGPEPEDPGTAAAAPARRLLEAPAVRGLGGVAMERRVTED